MAHRGANGGRRRGRGRRVGKRPRGAARSGGAREWVGARLPLPVLADDGDGPYRPDIALWLELPDGLIVGQRMLTGASEEEREDGEEGGLARALRDAIERPMAGSPRRPERVRVPEHALVPEVRAVLGETVPLEVAPTPELEALVESMGEALAESDEAEAAVSPYLEGGRLRAESVGELFDSAAKLYRAAPWERIGEEQVIRADLPELGVEGACLSVLGGLGESFALLVFPSLEAWQGFVERLPEEPPESPEDVELDLGTLWLALDFERGADLPDALRREIARHGWPVADASGYPVLRRFGPDAGPEPLEERDVRTASLCAAALAVFVREHGDVFATWESDRAEGACSWIDVGERHRVRLTAPYDSLEQAEAADAEVVQGGGPRAEGPPATTRAAQATGGERLLELDEALAARLAKWGVSRFGPVWKGLAERDFAAPEEALDLVAPWALYGVRVEGRTLLEAYLEEEGRRLPPAERAVAEAQRAAWLSVWEVEAVAPEEGIVELRDLLSHEARRVRDREAARTVPPEVAILARVVEHAEGAFLCGVHPRPLPLERAADLVRRARGRLGRRKRAVPPERLRDEGFARYLIRRWDAELADLDAESWLDAEVLGPDGRPLDLVTERFGVAQGGRERVAARLAAEETALELEREDETASFLFLERPEDSRAPADAMRVLGRAELSGDELLLQSYSAEGAELVRARVESACGGLLRHHVRTQLGPRPPVEPPPPRGRGPSSEA